MKFNNDTKWLSSSLDIKNTLIRFYFPTEFEYEWETSF